MLWHPNDPQASCETMADKLTWNKCTWVSRHPTVSQKGWRKNIVPQAGWLWIGWMTTRFLNSYHTPIRMFLYSCYKPPSGNMRDRIRVSNFRFMICELSQPIRFDFLSHESQMGGLPLPTGHSPPVIRDFEDPNSRVTTHKWRSVHPKSWVADRLWKVCNFWLMTCNVISDCLPQVADQRFCSARHESCTSCSKSRLMSSYGLHTLL